MSVLRNFYKRRNILRCLKSILLKILTHDNWLISKITTFSMDRSYLNIFIICCNFLQFCLNWRNCDFQKLQGCVTCGRWRCCRTRRSAFWATTCAVGTLGSRRALAASCCCCPVCAPSARPPSSSSSFVIPSARSPSSASLETCTTWKNILKHYNVEPNFLE